MEYFGDAEKNSMNIVDKLVSILKHFYVIKIITKLWFFFNQLIKDRTGAFDTLEWKSINKMIKNWFLA